MTTKIRLLLSALIFLIISIDTTAQIYSTTTGGNWADSTTWIGFKIPSVNDSVIIQGPVTFYFNNPVIKHLHIKDAGALVDGWASTLTIKGNLTVDADLLDGPSQIYVGGNLVVNKKWSREINLNFTGTQSHTIITGETAEFGPGSIFADSSKLIPLSNFIIISDYITETRIKEIDLSGGFDLYLTNCRLGGNGGNHTVTKVKGEGNNIYFNSPKNLQHYFENCELENVNLHGYSIFTSNVKLSGNVTNIDTMVAGFTTQPITVEGEFINNGVIPNRWLSFNIYGNITNNNLFMVANLNFIGANDFKIKTTTNKYIDCSSLYVNDGKLIADSDLYIKVSTFVAKEFNLSNYNVIALDTRFGLWSSPVKTKIIGNENNIIMYNTNYGGWYENCDLQDVNLKGKSVLGNNVVFYGTVANKDTLMNMDSPAYQYLVNVEGNLINEGYVGYIKGFNIKGNFEEKGDWRALNTSLVGINDQLVKCSDIIESKLELHSDIAGTSYQWQKNGENIQNANSAVLTLNTVTTNDFGIYKCITNNGESRNITIEEFLNSEFMIYDVSISYVSQTSTKIEWKTTVPAQGFIFYAENDTTNGYPFEAPEDGNLKTEHSITLLNLNYNSTYYFIIDQNDANWNNIRSIPYSFIAGDSTVRVDENISSISFYLSQNYPNPFNPNTNINFSLPKADYVTLKIYDILGKEVTTLINEELNAGNYSVNWDASNFSSGVYFYKLSAANNSLIRKMILLK